MENRDQADFDFLTQNGQAGHALNLPNFIHLDQPSACGTTSELPMISPRLPSRIGCWIGVVAMVR